jgi:hypothetical protein
MRRVVEAHNKGYFMHKVIQSQGDVNLLFVGCLDGYLTLVCMKKERAHIQICDLIHELLLFIISLTLYRLSSCTLNKLLCVLIISIIYCTK